MRDSDSSSENASEDDFSRLPPSAPQPHYRKSITVHRQNHVTGHARTSDIELRERVKEMVNDRATDRR